MRIASLVPGVTETLISLGAADELVAVTHHCELPDGASVPAVTLDPFGNTSYSRKEVTVFLRMMGHAAQEGVLAVDQEQLAATQPDVVFMQGTCDSCAPGSEEDDGAVLEGLPSEARVITTQPHSLGEVLADVRRIGQAVGRAPEAETLLGDLRKRMMTVMRTAAMSARTRRPNVALLEWIDPPVGGGMWLPEIVEAAGGIPAIGTRQAPAIQTPWQSIVEAKPDVLVIALTAFDIDETVGELPLLRKKEGWADLPAVAEGEVYLIDGSRHLHRAAPSIIDGLALVATALHPDVFPKCSEKDVRRATTEEIAALMVA
jgi:iron complex transport system substrate-binding protein